jgi:hypothetical protein
VVAVALQIATRSPIIQATRTRDDGGRGESAMIGRRGVAAGLILTVSAGLLVGSTRAGAASPSGRRNTAVAAGAASAFSAAQGALLPAAVLGAGSLAAYAHYRLGLQQQKRRQQRIARLKAWFKENRAWLREQHRLPQQLRKQQRATGRGARLDAGTTRQPRVRSGR